jgi:hypothetical protein
MMTLAEEWPWKNVGCQVLPGRPAVHRPTDGKEVLVGVK